MLETFRGIYHSHIQSGSLFLTDVAALLPGSGEKLAMYSIMYSGIALWGSGYKNIRFIGGCGPNLTGNVMCTNIFLPIGYLPHMSIGSLQFQILLGQLYRMRENRSSTHADGSSREIHRSIQRFVS